MLKQRKVLNISPDEMNRHLSYVRDNFYAISFDDPIYPLANVAYIEERTIYFNLKYRYGPKQLLLQCRKDGAVESDKIGGPEAFRILSKYYKVPRMPAEFCKPLAMGGLSAAPFLWFNPSHQNKWIKAYCYDQNSAYSYAMLGPMPDTSVPMRCGEIKEGEEIGFWQVPSPTETAPLAAKYSGYSQYIFPLMESPFKRFVDTWYKRKSGAEANKAKQVLNHSIGYLQRVNPFIRATIISRCNETIKALINKKTTLLCSTDSITTTVPLDLPLGSKIGEWKIEHEGYVAYRGNNYQWSDGTAAIRGMPKSLTKNIDLTSGANICLDFDSEIWYSFNKNKLQLEAKHG